MRYRSAKVQTHRGLLVRQGSWHHCRYQEPAAVPVTGTREGPEDYQVLHVT